jgi:probable rRNA maturation factor
MNVFLDMAETVEGLDPQPFEVFACQLLHAANESDGELSITFVGDDMIHELNRQYRDKDHPTDVLSFAMREGEAMGRLEPLGDIVISIDTAKRQAETMGHSVHDEIFELLFHGFLHLLGEDHEGDNRDSWHALEEKIKQSLQAENAVYVPKGLENENTKL